MSAQENADSFVLYGLAMEYRKLERSSDALAVFTRLKETFPQYLPTYLMAGQELILLKRFEDASSWIQLGMEVARDAGDMKTLGELESALEECE